VFVDFFLNISKLESGKFTEMKPHIYSTCTQQAVDPHASEATLVEREALVRAFSPDSTLDPGLKAFRQRGPKCSLETPPPLVPVGITNHDKRSASQRHFPAVIDVGF
jgi:hypothetical protein